MTTTTMWQEVLDDYEAAHRGRLTEQTLRVRMGRLERWWNQLQADRPERMVRVSPISIDLEPIELGEFIDVAGWPDPVLSRASVRWLRTPSIVATFEPAPNRAVAVESLTVEGSRSRPITSADLRSFQFRQLTNALVTFLGTWGPESLWATVSISQIGRDDIERARERQRTNARRRENQPLVVALNLSDDMQDLLSDPEQLAELRARGPRTAGAVDTVNAILDYAADHGLSPHPLVREVMGLPKATASRWIATARELRKDGAP